MTLIAHMEIMNKTHTFFMLHPMASFNKESEDCRKSSLENSSVLSGSNKDDAKSSTKFATFLSSCSSGPRWLACSRSLWLTCIVSHSFFWVIGGYQALYYKLSGPCILLGPLRQSTTDNETMYVMYHPHHAENMCLSSGFTFC